MRRIAVVGPGGAGKTTFAGELGRRLGVPVVHLDEHFWGPGWTATPRPAWRAVQAELLAGDTWIADGNYGSTFDIRFARADTVIVLQPPPLICLAGALRRSLGGRGQAIQAAGCPERFELEVLRWIWRYPREGRPRLDCALGPHRDRLRIVELPSRREAAGFLARLDEPCQPPGA
jgi:adenylate kinase family enzyme